MVTTHFSKDKSLIFNLQKTAEGNLNNIAHQKIKGLLILLICFFASGVIFLELIWFKLSKKLRSHF